MSRTSLARCVGDGDEFLLNRFGREPHLWRAAGSRAAGSDAAFDDLLSMADVDRQLTTAGLRRPAVRAVRDGEVIDPGEWTRSARTGAVHVDDLVHPGKLLGLFDQGATIVLQSLQRWWPPLMTFCRELERDLGHAVQANAYLTPPGAAGLTPHHDTHDVFVMQVHGTKHWTVREPLIADPLDRHRSDHEQAAGQPTLFEEELQPGDCLYLPRGFIHSAAAQQGASLHLTIGVLVTTVHDVLHQLVARAAEEPVFRRTLSRPTDRSEEAARSVLKQILGDFSRWIDEFEPERGDRILTLLTGPTRRPPILDGQLLELANIGALSDDSVVRLREFAVVGANRTADHLELDLGDRRVQLPPYLDAPVSMLIDGEVHPVTDLACWLDAPSRLVLVRRLIREGVLRTASEVADGD